MKEFYLKLMLEGFVKTINKSVWIASNQGQIKRSLSVKNVIALNFMHPILLTIFICNIARFVMYKNGSIVKN